MREIDFATVKVWRGFVLCLVWVTAHHDVTHPLLEPHLVTCSSHSPLSAGLQALGVPFFVFPVDTVCRICYLCARDFE
jgi:hypothetical protein